MSKPPSLNPPRRVRIGVYLTTAIGTPVVAYLLAKGIISDLEVALWSAEVAVATGLAALNTGGSDETPPPPPQVVVQIDGKRLAQAVVEDTVAAAVERGRS